MKKLAFSNSDNLVYVTMSPNEFKTATKQLQGSVVDGASVSIEWIKDMSAMVDVNKATLTSVATQATALATTINTVLK